MASKPVKERNLPMQQREVGISKSTVDTISVCMKMTGKMCLWLSAHSLSFTVPSSSTGGEWQLSVQLIPMMPNGTVWQCLSSLTFGLCVCWSLATSPTKTSTSGSTTRRRSMIRNRRSESASRERLKREIKSARSQSSRLLQAMTLLSLKPKRQQSKLKTSKS